MKAGMRQAFIYGRQEGYVNFRKGNECRMRKKGKGIGTVLLATILGLSTAFVSVPVSKAAEGVQVVESDDFVTAEDGKFRLNGSDFYYAGTNCYYLNFKPSEDVDTLLEEAADMGLTVIRTWGHLDVGTISTTGEVDKDGAPYFANSVDGGAKEKVYYQYFDGEKQEPVVNEGEYGLQKMDYVIAKAQEEGIKLILTFTNNWSPFGGMDQYVKWAGLEDHNEFYTNEKIKGWFKNYISTMLNHVNVYTGVAYKDDPTIFAWELANEPRSNDNLAANGTVYEWAKEMSEYVKEIDSNHMVAVGDEGCLRYDSNNKEDMQMLEDLGVNFNWTNWGGGMGTDFERMLTIDTIDFATPHLYLRDWSFSEEDAKAWLYLHGKIAEEQKKPIILEEFGWKAADEGTAFDSKDDLFEVAYDIIEGEGEYSYSDICYQGSNYWMIASHMIADGQIYPDYDGFTVYSCPDQVTESVRQQIIAHAEYMNNKGDKNRIDEDELKADLANMTDSKVTLTVQSDAELESLTMNGEKMQEGTEYTIQDSVVTFPAAYLSQLEEGRYYITFNMTTGVEPELMIQVVDSSITGAKLLQESFTFDKNPKIAKNVTIPISVNDAGSLRSVKLCGKGSTRTLLTEGTDYTFENETLTIKAAYLTAITEKSAELELDFDKGEDPLVTIDIKDSTGNEIIDDFEGYADDTAAASAWTQNNGGGDITRTIVTGKSDSKALSYEYNYEGRWWAGIQKSLSNVDLSKFAGVQIWLQPDGSNNTLTLKLRDAENVYWEYALTLEGTEPQVVKIPFSDFKMNSGTASGNMGDQRFTGVEIIIGNGSNSTASSGTIYIDNFEAYADGAADVEIVPVTGVTLNQDTADLKVGESVTLTKTILPENATYQGVTWSSGNEAIATVKDGVVEAKRAGNTTITVTTNSGNFTATCEVRVQAASLGDNDIDIGEFGTEDITEETTAGSTTENQTTTENVETTTELPIGGAEPTTEATTTERVTENVEPTTAVSTTERVTENVEPTTAVSTTERVTENIEPTTAVSTTERVTENTESTTAVTTEGTTEVTTENSTEVVTPPEKVTVESVSLNKLATSIQVGESEQLAVTVLPVDAANKEVTWKSNHADIASVDSTGVVTAKAAGTAEITVTTVDGGFSATCTVIVKEKTEPVVAVTNVVLNTDATTILVGKAAALTATVLPIDASESGVTWTSDNEAIATVDKNGVVTAKAAGEAVITVTTVDGGKTASCKITVKEETQKEISVTGVIFDKSSITMRPAEKETLTVSILPEDATNKNISWTNTNEKVATISRDGEIVAISEGTTMIIATSEDGGKTATCTVTVVKEGTEEIKVESISLNKITTSITEGGYEHLSVDFLPADASNKNVIWTSDNETVATVDTAGIVTGCKEGSAVITVTTVDGGKQASCVVTVTKQAAIVVPVKSIILNAESITLTEGKSTILNATILPIDATENKVTWTSDHETIATVDAMGTVNAVSAGTAIITAASADGTVTASCKVEVVKAAEATVSVDSIELDQYSITLEKGATKTLTATILPADATNKEISWISGDSEIVTVDDKGNVTALKEGSTIVVVTAKDGGKMAICKVEVPADAEQTIAVQNITFTKVNVDMYPGDTEKLEVVIFPDNATNKEITWQSSDSKVVTVEQDGTIKAVAAGAAQIIAVTADGGKIATCNVTVKTRTTEAQVIPVSSIQVTPTEKTLALKKSVNLKVQVLPVNATDKTVTYTSNNTNVAKVSATGKVTAVAPGQAVITVSSKNQVKATVIIQVKPGKVTKIKKKSIKTTSVKLTWKKQKGVTGYKVYRYDTKTKKYKLYKTTKKNSITLKKLKKNTSYKFRIKAYKKSGSAIIYGNYSDWVRFKTKK